MPGRSAKFSSQRWKLSHARSSGGEGNRVVQCHIITESPVTDAAAPGLVFQFGPDFTASLLSEEELKREVLLTSESNRMLAKTAISEPASAVISQPELV